MPGPRWLTTFALGRDGNRATLVIQKKTADKTPTTGAAWEWKCKQSTMLAGTIEDRKGELAFRFQDASRSSADREVVCVARNIRVAEAKAVRVSVPSAEEGCNKHRWSSKARVNRAALVCTSKDHDWVEWPRREVFAGPVPGIEHITLDEDDCFDPVDSLRVMQANGELAPVQ